MTVSSVSNINFNGTAYSKNGNEYKKTYIGRIVGTGAGLGLAIATLRAKNGAGKIVKFVEKYKTPIKKAIENLTKDNPAMKESIQKFVTKGKNILGSPVFRKAVKYATPIVAAWLLAGTYIKGAIVDRVINAKRANKADQLAEV